MGQAQGMEIRIQLMGAITAIVEIITIITGWITIMDSIEVATLTLLWVIATITTVIICLDQTQILQIIWAVAITQEAAVLWIITIAIATITVTTCLIQEVICFQQIIKAINSAKIITWGEIITLFIRITIAVIICSITQITTICLAPIEIICLEIVITIITTATIYGITTAAATTCSIMGITCLTTRGTIFLTMETITIIMVIPIMGLLRI